MVSPLSLGSRIFISLSLEKSILFAVSGKELEIANGEHLNPGNNSAALCPLVDCWRMDFDEGRRSLTCHPLPLPASTLAKLQ